MTSPYGAEERPGRGRAAAVAFVIGVLGGVLGAVLLPRLLHPYLPAALRGEKQVLEGVVIAKGAEGGRLLITLSTSQGTMLATFTEETAKIDLLVRAGDTLSLGAREYSPFIENPRIVRVVSTGGVPRAVPADTVSSRPAAPADTGG